MRHFFQKTQLQVQRFTLQVQILLGSWAAFRCFLGVIAPPYWIRAARHWLSERQKVHRERVTRERILALSQEWDDLVNDRSKKQRMDALNEEWEALMLERWKNEFPPVKVDKMPTRKPVSRGRYTRQPGMRR